MPETGHLTIQSAINDARCTEIDLKAQICRADQRQPGGSSGNASRDLGRARTVLASPLRRNRSTVSTTFLRNYVYVVQVAPGSTLTLADLTVDGGGNARAGLLRPAGPQRDAQPGRRGGRKRARAGHRLCLRQCLLRLASPLKEPVRPACRSVGQRCAASSKPASWRAAATPADLGDTLVRGVGEQNQQAQTGIWVRDGATAALDRATVRDLRFYGRPVQRSGAPACASARCRIDDHGQAFWAATAASSYRKLHRHRHQRQPLCRQLRWSLRQQ